MTNSDKLTLAFTKLAAADEHLENIYNEELHSRKRQKLISNALSGLLGAGYGAVGGGMLASSKMKPLQNDQNHAKLLLGLLGGATIGGAGAATANNFLMNHAGYRTKNLEKGLNKLKG